MKLTPERLEQIITELEAKKSTEMAFGKVTFGELLKLAKLALESLEEEAGVTTAHNTMAQFMERHDG